MVNTRTIIASVSALAVATGFAAAQEPEQPAEQFNTTTATNLQFINPISGTKWSYSEDQIITWTAPTVSDPQNISLLIANVYNYSMLPAYPTPLALNIFANQSQFALTNISIPVGDGYVILMADIYNSSNIYAQGGVFSVNSSDSTEPAGSGFSIASMTTIIANAPAGGATTIAQEPTGAPAPMRMVRHRRNADMERVAH